MAIFHCYVSSSEGNHELIVVLNGFERQDTTSTSCGTVAQQGYPGRQRNVGNHLGHEQRPIALHIATCSLAARPMLCSATAEVFIFFIDALIVL